MAAASTILSDTPLTFLTSSPGSGMTRRSMSNLLCSSSLSICAPRAKSRPCVPMTTIKVIRTTRSSRSSASDMVRTADTVAPAMAPTSSVAPAKSVRWVQAHVTFQAV